MVRRLRFDVSFVLKNTATILIVLSEGAMFLTSPWLDLIVFVIIICPCSRYCLKRDILYHQRIERREIYQLLECR